MLDGLKKRLAKSSSAIAIKEALRPDPDGMTGVDHINVLRRFPLYAPSSAGNYRSRADLTLQTIDKVFSVLADFASTLGFSALPVQDITTAADTTEKQNSALKLKKALQEHGSDKASGHIYHYLYGSILVENEKIRRIFEIGLGTNNTDVVSNMGEQGAPGASLRAFRDYCPNAHVFGADIDRRVLFKEDRIETYFIDQTDRATFDDLLRKLPSDFDLVIDDGLHSPDANIASLAFALQLIKVGGWAVIEDITAAALPVWQTVAALLGRAYEPYLYDSNGTLVFAVRRLS